MRSIHELKTWPVFFNKVWDGSKTAEIRQNDRDFIVGDLMDLKEFDPLTETYSGQWIEAEITDITTGIGLADGFVMLSFEILNRSDKAASEFARGE